MGFAGRSALKVSKRALLTILALAVLALLYFQALEIRKSAQRRVGFTFSATGPPVLESVVPESPAQQGGLKVGDRLVAVAGREVEDSLTYDMIAAGFERDRPVEMVVERGDRRQTLTVVPGMEASWRSFLLSALVCLGYLSLGLLAFYQRSDDVRARLLGLFALAVTVEMALPWQSIGSPALAVIATTALLLLSGFQAATELHLASLIPRRRSWLHRWPRIVLLYYGVGLGMSLVSTVAYLSDVAGWSVLPWSLSQVDRVFNYLFLPAWALGVVSLLLPPALTWPVPRERQQAVLVLLGTLPWVATMVVSVASTLLGRGRPEWFESVENLALLCYPLAVFAAIFRSHLFDLEVVVRRSAVYTTLTSVLILLFYGAVGVGGALFSRLVGDTGSVWVVGGATLLLGLAFSPLRSFLHQTISRRLFPEKAALRQRLVTLAGQLPAKVKLPAMGQHLVQEIKDIFTVRSATLWLARPESGTLVPLATTVESRQRPFEAALLLPMEDPAVARLVEMARPVSAAQLASPSKALARQLTRFQVDLAAPVLHHEDLVGMLWLGEKVDGRRFPGDEAELLDLLCRHVATVFENARLFESATDDSLTGLLRREAILERLGLELKRSVRYRRPLTIGMADLDHFKQVNDRYGHLVGDMMLQRMARALKAGLRGTDWVGRYGGEEFLIVLPESDLAGAATVAEKIRGLVEDETFITEEGHEVRSTISIGLASLWESNPGELTSTMGLIAAADRALYRAKHGGRNRVEPAEAVVA